MGLAHYTTPELVEVDSGIWYDQMHHVRHDKIVGWAIWYSGGDMFASLDTDPLNLPERDAQLLRVWHERTDGREGLWSCSYTRYHYPIPNSNVIIEGNWTNWQNHEAIFERAMAFKWP